MNIKDVLFEYPHMNENIQNLNNELNRLVEKKVQTRDTLWAAAPTGMPHGTEVSDPTYDAVETIIDKHDRQIARLAQSICKMMDLKSSIDNALLELSFQEHRIIELKYFNGHTMDEISQTMKCSKRQCYRILDEAMDKMSKSISADMAS